MAIILTLMARLAALAGSIAALAACIYATTSFNPVQFDTAKEARDFLMSQGLYCHSGGTFTSTAVNFYVADHPVGHDDFQLIPVKCNCGMTPAWKGIVWVCQIDNPEQRLQPESIGGNTRIWGNVLVAGDDDLMDRIEELYMKQ